MDERARNKRKLKELEARSDGDDDDAANSDGNDLYEAMDGVEAEKPGEGLRRKAPDSNKKQKVAEESGQELAINADEVEPKLSKKEAKRESKREKKAERKALKQDASSKSEGKTTQTQQEAPAETTADEQAPSRDGASAESGSEPQSPIFDAGDPSAALNEAASAEVASTSTSISSSIPPSEKPKHIKLPADSDAIRARVAARIEALRAARKATRPRNRQELLEERRKKAAQKAERKKEERKQARQEAARIREEALASHSPSVMSPGGGGSELNEEAGHFSFGRVAFGDGSKLSHDLSHVLKQGKRKGPSDVNTALLKVQNQNKRLQEMDPEKRADITEKEAWLTVRRRAEGEKIRDNEARLKKAKSRKDATKRKSKKEWQERENGVFKAQKEKQKKREENIKKRREDKLLGKAGKKKGGGAAGKKKKKTGGSGGGSGGRPGFEGSFGVGRRK